MGKDTQNLYKELMAVLASGQKAAIVSVYAKGGEITKSVAAVGGGEGFPQAGNVGEAMGNVGGGFGIAISKDDPTGTALSVPQDTADAVTDGPVTHFYGRNGALTVVERYLPRSRLIILGGGHIALALTQMARACEFYTVVFDDRPMFANKERFPAADEVICDEFSRLFERIGIQPSDYVVIVTRGHKHDQLCLEGVLKGAEPAYTGMIGSRRRVAIVLKQLAGAGHPQERLDAVYSPIGLRIGAVTPAEISVSILSEIIQVKRVKRAEKDSYSCDLETASKLAGHGEDADALITILETHGSVPRETGAKMSMSYEGSIMGTIGGGCAESGLMQDARSIIREGGWRTATVDMTDSAEEDGMVCGGHMTVLLERA